MSTEAAPAAATAPAPESAAAAAPAPAQAEEVKPGVPLENQVSEWKRKFENAASEAEELKRWKAEQEEKSMTELERERRRAEEAEKLAQAAQDRATTLERAAWVRAAAGEFADPDDAVAFANLKDIDTPDAAAAAVKEIAEKKPHLLKGTGQPTSFGRPSHGRVGDQPVPTDANGQPDVKQGIGRDLISFLTTGKQD